MYSFFLITRLHKYGTDIRANPAAKLPMPTDNVLIDVGYCNAVNVGIKAFVAPVAHLTGKIKQDK